MKTKIYRPTAMNIKRLGAMLAQGKLVGVPAETVYGLAADATNPDACAAIFEAKRRPAYDPLIVHVATIAQAKRLAEWNPVAERLAQQFWPGPLTLVLPKKDNVPDVVTSGLSTVAIRMPSHPLFKQLLRAAAVPLAAPSANPFGYISPTTAEHVREGLDGRIGAILDGGECPVGVESTIVKANVEGKVQLLRPGAISKTAIADSLGYSLGEIKRSRAGSASQKPAAPGQLLRHYSPKKPTKLWKRFPKHMSDREAWVHFLNAEHGDPSAPHHFFLSRTGRGEDAAKNLYRVLRQLDCGRFEKINLERIPAINPWAETLNDRMSRAAAR